MALAEEQPRRFRELAITVVGINKFIVIYESIQVCIVLYEWHWMLAVEI